MDPERWQRIGDVYDLVVNQPPELRVAVLRESCSGDSELQREVESLLAARDDAARDFLSPNDLSSQIADLKPSAAIQRSLAHYEILEVIGSGGMGDVYRARDSRLGREVALKVLQPDFIDNSARVARFKLEAKAASTLNHPNIVTIYEISEAGGTWFIAAELIDGVTVRERLKRGDLLLAEAVEIALQCAAALEAAHRAGIVHRDIKPENIMVRPDGIVKVVDFGLARMVQPQPEWLLEKTRSGSVMGTPRYMSPEQARGKPLDPRSDIFSLGAVLFEMIAGRAAFSGETTAEIFAALLGSEPEMSAAGNFAAVISKALEKNRELRYQTIAQFADDLRRVDPKATQPLALRLSMAVRPRRRALKIAGTVSLVVLPVLAAFSWVSRWRIPPAANLKFTTLTAFGGSKRHPVFSPDSGSIAFSWKAPYQETHHIYVKPVAGGEPLQLTFGSQEDEFPSWSPDGQRIAFCRRAISADERALVSSGVYVIPAAGGTARQIAKSCAGLSWSPDGKTLAVARVPEPGQDAGGIDLLFPDSGGRRRLTKSGEDLHPVYSPDGDWLAFIRVLPGRGRGREIFVVPVTGGLPRQLTFDGQYTTGATWTADSREVVFSSPRDASQGSLWRVPVSGGAPRPHSSAVRNGCFPSISRRGDRMAFVDCSTDSNIYLRAGPGFPPAGKPWLWESPRGVALSTGTDHTPTFSPDGEHFAFVSDRNGNQQIWVSRRDGSEARQLTSDPTRSAGSPRWSPDGAWIAFDLWASNQSHVYIVSSAGGVPWRLSLETAESWNPAWSHDGAWIYFASDRSKAKEIWKMPVAGGAAMQVTHTGAFEGRPDPDGKFLYFRKRTPAGCCSIWSVPVGGGREQPVRELERFATIGTSWAVLRQGIYFISKETAPVQKVRFLDFATREVTEVAGLQKEPEWSFPSAGLSPDGRSLLTVQVDREVSDLTMIENLK